MTPAAQQAMTQPAIECVVGMPPRPGQRPEEGAPLILHLPNGEAVVLWLLKCRETRLPKPDVKA